MGNCQGKVFKSKITPLNGVTTIEGVIINTKEPSNPDEDIDGKYICFYNVLMIIIYNGLKIEDMLLLMVKIYSIMEKYG